MIKRMHLWTMKWLIGSLLHAISNPWNGQYKKLFGSFFPFLKWYIRNTNEICNAAIVISHISDRCSKTLLYIRICVLLYFGNTAVVIAVITWIHCAFSALAKVFSHRLKSFRLDILLCHCRRSREKKHKNFMDFHFLCSFE